MFVCFLVCICFGFFGVFFGGGGSWHWSDKLPYYNISINVYNIKGLCVDDYMGKGMYKVQSLPVDFSKLKISLMKLLYLASEISTASLLHLWKNCLDVLSIFIWIA